MNSGGMDPANAKVYSLATSLVPFWKLFPVLKFSVKNVYWTAKDMKALYMVMVCEGSAGEMFKWRCSMSWMR